MKTPKTISRKFTYKIIFTFLLLILAVGMSYAVITLYFTDKYFEETSQKLNAQIANHLINEKFQNESPFLEDGTVNKPLFGDIMHDMMAINQSIEVYLLNKEGEVLYSVVLDHDKAGQDTRKVDLKPVNAFIACNGNRYVLGDDPRDPGSRKIFSAAPLKVGDHEGYIYIVLAGQEFEKVQASLLTSYYLKLGLGASVITIFFAAIIGTLVIWYLTKNLRKITFAVTRFKEGDMSSRVENPEKMDLSVLGTTFNEMAETIVINIEKLQSVEALRRELIANVSHDLRTPLSIMQGYVETLQIKKGALKEEEGEKYLGIIQRSIEKLSHLINQLFEFSKLEARQIEPQKEPFQLGELAQDVYSKYEILARKKDIHLKLEVDENLPLVFADISLVERVLQNLMDNALKYTPESGSVTLKINAGKRQLEVAIIDNGPGISEYDQKFIFERFKQVRQSRQDHSGAGLGLAIVKKIIEIHESTIKVMSKPDEGTTFLFSLPAYSPA